MRRYWTWVYILLQCTWGILQTVVGLLVFLWYAGSPHERFGGAVHTRWNRTDGLSLGLFIFTPKREDLSLILRTHEYGHTIQSLLLGPFYLILVGIPSDVWANFPACVQWRRRNGISYSWFFAERWADRLGEAMLKMWIR